MGFLIDALMWLLEAPPGWGRSQPIDRTAVHALSRASRVLGLTSANGVARGQLDGIAISAWISYVQPLGHAELACSAALPRPLGIDLDLAQRRAGDSVLAPPALRFATRPDLGRVRASAREPGLAARLLGGEVDALLLKAARARLTVRMDDWHVTLVSPAASHDAVWMLRLSVRIVEALERARDGLPRSDHEEAVREGWEIAARSTGATFDPVQERLTHDLGSARLGAALKWEGGWRTRLSLEFSSPLVERLDVSRTEAHGRLGVWLRGEIELGDPEFDAAFVVRGSPEGRVRDLLSDGARELLGELAKVTDHVVLTQDRLEAELESVVAEASEVTRLIANLTQLADALTRCDHPRAAYR